MSDVLAEICAVKREHVAAGKRARSMASLLAELPDERPRGFAAALRRTCDGGGHALIAEVKKASPSKGLIRADFDPARLAQAYRDGGASCLSVLTDAPYFQGADAFLDQARQASGLPALRKDFMLDPWQIAESRQLGADCILLILACLDDGQVAELAAQALELGMDVLAEVHDAQEMERALRLPDTCLLGVNNRNLKSLRVDLATFELLAPMVPPDRFLVAESGLYAHADLLRMRDAGARAYLVGESLMREADVTAATCRLLGRS
ncbi:MAG TPA: indole-3-glycerol phosphate synthase TrpC [Geminicoccus sp.]|uniref:indole-3-glycerol phosphate synthase TrpC n=1 Tax=Geminicoccus sp. TaxID=2024832 RepID=UPI002C383DF7|nr:indole-3-glycerol phosphate synthase TrpC [Geminicoccus sp.]HWL70502.1 indole-3-glycerol phosphate synthase TrpC [Geminicoccus sp.]